jgi:hypothetical protein
MEKMILFTLIISLCTVGVHATTWEKMIFHRPATWLKRKLPVWIYKPAFDCMICMSSVYSILFWIIFGTFNIIYLPVVILTVAGINAILTAILSPILPDETDEQE